MVTVRDANVCTFRICVSPGHLPRHSVLYFPVVEMSIRARSTAQKIEHGAQSTYQMHRASIPPGLGWIRISILSNLPSAMSSLSTDVQGGLVDAGFVQAITQK